MKTKTSYLYFAYILLATTLQLTVGNISEVFFRFPLNLTILLLLLVILYSFQKSKICKELSGKRGGFIAILYLIICSFIVGFTPQLTPAAANEKSGLAGLLGIYNFIQSWFMAGAIVLLIANLWLITLKRLSLASLRNHIGFLLNHTGLLLVLSCGYFGSADIEKLRMQVNLAEPSALVYTPTGKTHQLPFTIQLQNFEISHYPDGSPMHYIATLELNQGESLRKLQVNHPARYGGYDLYLISYGEGYCIIELQKQPWKYGIAVGILLMLGGAISIFNRRREL